jgi:hypothetical protein
MPKTLRRFTLAVLAACLLAVLPGTTGSAGARSAESTLRVFVTGNGSITGSGVNCGVKGSVCSASYALGTTITLEAVPARFSVFAGWSGACNGISPTCTLDAGAPVTVTATFGYIEVVDVNKVGDGEGTVTSLPEGIDCGYVCAAPYTGDTKVSLVAEPAPGSVFAGWGGSCSGTAACEVQQSYGAIGITARFELRDKPDGGDGGDDGDGGDGGTTRPPPKTTPKPKTTTPPVGARAFLTRSLGSNVRKTASGHVFTVRLSSTHAALLTLELYRGGTKVSKPKPLKINRGVVTVRVPLARGAPTGTYQIYATIKSIENRRQGNLKWVFRVS